MINIKIFIFLNLKKKTLIKQHEILKVFVLKEEFLFKHVIM